MLTTLQYILTYVLTHPHYLVAVLIIGGGLLMGYRLAKDHGLAAILLLGTALIVTGCVLGMFFGSIVVSGLLAQGLPGFACSTLDFCPPGSPSSVTPTPPASGTDFQLGHYKVNDTSADHCATLRSPDPTSDVAGCIPNGVIVNVIQFISSNCISNICKRAEVDPVNSFPKGWVHAVTLVYQGP